MASFSASQVIAPMVPGINKMRQLKNAPEPDEKELGKTDAIIRSITIKERPNHRIIDSSRRQLIAAGSGTTVNDVNRVLKSYSAMLKMMKKMRGKPGVMSGKKRRKVPKGMRR